MKASVCITVFNEEMTIGTLLDSLFVQTKKPDEIVIVDGGSKDKTIEIIKHYQKKDSRIRYLVEKGGIAHARNVSIELAKNEIIALIDAGCVARKDWLQKITEPLAEPKVNFVAGYYEMIGESPLQLAIAPFHGIPRARYNPRHFVPSARSMAFRKKVWQEVGGFREKLERAGEDTLFNYEAVKKGFRPVRVKDAIVYWEVPRTLKESLKKFFNYARGDAMAGIWWNPSQQFASHNLKISLIFFRYLLGLTLLILSFWDRRLPSLLIILFGFYVFWSIWKWRDVVTDWRARVWLPIIQISSDFTVMGGFLAGLLLPLRKIGKIES